jgi:hypothetical protein
MTCIELIGCTSAGKSTLTNHILQLCRDDGIDISLGDDFLLNQFHLGWVGQSTFRAALVNLISLPVALINWGKYHRYFGFAFRTTTRLPISLPENAYLCRNILKNIGIYEIARTRAKDRQVIILDEGPLNSANLLFVHVAVALPDTGLSEFVQVVPLPDAAFYLREQEDVLTQRTLARGHKRIQNGNLGEVEKFVHSAVALFERLAQEPAVRTRLFIVNNHQVQNDPGKFILNVIHARLNQPSEQPVFHVSPPSIYEEKS